MARNERAAADDALQEAIDLAGDDEENAEIREQTEELIQTLRNSDDDSAINTFDPCTSPGRTEAAGPASARLIHILHDADLGVAS
jgi:hypothetical protein